MHSGIQTFQRVKLASEEGFRSIILSAEGQPAEDRKAATEKLRTFQKAMKPSRTDVSEQEFEAAELEAMRSVRPHYAPMS